MTDKFRIGHLLLHKLLDFRNSSFFAQTNAFRNGSQAREAFERGLAEVLNQQVNLAEELDHITGQSSEASKSFRQSLSENETSHWAYARRVFANRESVQQELARNGQLRLDYPFLDFVLDENNGMRKLNALQHLGEAMRFIALVRTVLSGKVTQGEAYQMSIAQGLEKMTEIVMEKGVILDRGRTVTSRDHVMKLFDGFKQLWDRFSQLENAANKTFLDYFECQQVAINASSGSFDLKCVFYRQPTNTKYQHADLTAPEAPTPLRIFKLLLILQSQALTVQKKELKLARVLGS
ncbi:hypothetical protein DAPPUDRAFT_101482 [Daphnia pulex]|uniref:Uncharacterized protein n=1 Tax=Daphnia pulex TaxID=6669 RepID=E9GDI8_DAPPU|nr:hypothetical protein DAPPUDRAFT_101482 [Daphnia pulex]|eukprot:EFX82471.1 hypothetical protein DAPPUDRAFT_101482 [Daphnia pulex]